jgi:hypothetical protein
MKQAPDYFNDLTTLTSREAYDYYRANRKKTAVGINEYRLYVKAINGLFAELGRMIAAAQGGVYIEELGYFCHVVEPTKRVKKGVKKTLLSKYNKHHHYFPYFFPDKDFKDFTMSGAFYDYIYRRKSKDEKYLLHFDLCESYKEATLLHNRFTKFKQNI